MDNNDISLIEYSVYGLFCPVDNVFKYIGVSKHPELRFRQHLSEKIGARRAEWISFLKSKQLIPLLHIFHVSTSVDEVSKMEVDLCEKFKDTITNAPIYLHRYHGKK